MSRMLLRMLFTHSYFLKLDPKQDQWNKPYPPVMTLLAAGVLEGEKTTGTAGKH